MALSTTDQQLIGAETSLQEPHFDEEVTVLSARPVVPLARVKTTRGWTSFPRPWILGLAMVGALVVGISATSFYYSSSNGDDSKLFQGTNVAAGVEGNSMESANSFSGPAAPQPKVDIDSPEEAKRQTVAKNQPDRASAGEDKKPRARLVAVIQEKKSSNHTAQENQEDRRAARKQARQERRRAEREKRDGKSSDELLRIRDIFEGSPRP